MRRFEPTWRSFIKTDKLTVGFQVMDLGMVNKFYYTWYPGCAGLWTALCVDAVKLLKESHKEVYKNQTVPYLWIDCLKYEEYRYYAVSLGIKPYPCPLKEIRKDIEIAKFFSSWIM